MRRIIVSVLLALAAGLTAAPRGERAAFFTPDSLPELTLRVPLDQWNALLAAYDKNRRAIPYVKADCLFTRGTRTERIKDVGLRIRGGAFSRIRPELERVHVPDAGTFRQAHFKLSFSKFKKNRRIHGMRSCNIKMFNGDPALVREVFAMDFLRRAGVPLAHHSSFVRLSLHILSDRKAVYLGVFRMNEVVDKTFVEDRFPGTKPGWLWKCLWPADLRTATVKAGRAPMGTGEGGRTTYELKTRTKELAKGKDAFLRFMQEL
jgi:spore coat protein CotH